jgi:hypothetical protein
MEPHCHARRHPFEGGFKSNKAGLAGYCRLLWAARGLQTCITLSNLWQRCPWPQQNMGMVFVAQQAKAPTGHLSGTLRQKIAAQQVAALWAA